ncbi:hypothetical protein CR513_22932, partial [Mucuna pruriens]
MPHVVAEVPKGGEGLSVGRQLTGLMRVLGKGEKDCMSPRSTKKEVGDEPHGNGRDDIRVDTRHRGVITTILRGSASMADGSSIWRRGVRDVLAVCMKSNYTTRDHHI